MYYPKSYVGSIIYYFAKFRRKLNEDEKNGPRGHSHPNVYYVDPPREDTSLNT